MSETKRHTSPMKSQNAIAAKKFKSMHTHEITESLKNPGVLSSQDNSLDFVFDDDDDFDLQAIVTNFSKLDLSYWKRCIVDHVERLNKNFDVVLRVRAAEAEICENNENGAIAYCHLQEAWSNTHIEAGDVVSLRGYWDEQLNAYKVTNDQGFCVTNPDFLISGTSVAGSMFCRRKAVLQDRFRGIDPTNKVMVVGTLVHEILQKVLAKGLKTYAQIDTVVQEFLHSQEIVYTLFTSCLTLAEIKLEIQKFVPNILAFMKQYVEGQEPAVLQADTFQGCITEIKDIEENLWVPQLGLKGKVDASVRIQRRPKSSLKFSTAANQPTIPLELKTGRASFSMEHKGQLILYQMMMTVMGTREIKSGLLFYLRDGIMREINGKRNEERDLIVLRNDLSHYLTRPPQLPAANAPLTLGDEKFVQPFELPEPISHHSACSSCAYATICCAFTKTDSKLQLREGHPYRRVMAEATAHLQLSEYEYFLRWCGLLALEEQETKSSNYMRALWTLPPEVRQQQGRAVMGLQLRGQVLFEQSHYVHTFVLVTSSLEEESIDLIMSGFSIGEYVIVSTSKRLAIAAGFVQALSTTMIVLTLERDLLQNYANNSFIVDKHESQFGNVFNFTNLSLLLENNKRANALRAIIVQRQQPVFNETLPTVLSTEGAEIMLQLNAVQRCAVLKALTTDSFMLIKGLPGTGKTQTLVAIVRLLYLMGKSVLITSHTHSAVDNLLLRLKPHGLPMLRLGTGKRVHSELRDYSETELMKDCCTESQLETKYKMYNIVGVTCLGAAHSIFQHRQFDFCIVDEATQVLQPTVLRPLYFSAIFILVGDPDQLPPLIRCKEARIRGADESLFQRLDTPGATSVLTVQYRMNKTIMRLANELTYAGALQCASKMIKTATLKLHLDGVERWVQRVLQPHIDRAVYLLNTSDCAERSFAFASMKHRSACAAIEKCFAEEAPTVVSSTNSVGAQSQSQSQSPTKSSQRRLSKYTNYCDAAVIFHILKVLLAAGYDPERIGIIAPYRAQVELLRTISAQQHSYFQTQKSQLNFELVEINTVDQYQGRDKDIILYSCAKTGAPSARAFERVRETEILEDKRRLNVAITRSKLKLILVGDAACMEQYTPFRALFAEIPTVCKILLEDCKHGFKWQTLLDELSKIISN